jgi:hypothetical protein
MDLITLLAVIFIVVGLALVLAGYFLPAVSPDAARAGWGLLALGVILLIVVFLVDELGDTNVHDKGASAADDEARSSWGHRRHGAAFGPLGFLWSYLQNRSVSKGRAASRVPPRP